MAESTPMTADERVALRERAEIAYARGLAWAVPPRHVLALLDALDATEAERDAALADVAQLHLALELAMDDQRAWEVTHQGIERIIEAERDAARAEVARLTIAVGEAAVALAVLAHEEGQRVLAPDVLAQVRRAMAAIDAALAEPQSGGNHADRPI